MVVKVRGPLDRTKWGTQQVEFYDFTGEAGDTGGVIKTAYVTVRRVGVDGETLDGTPLDAHAGVFLPPKAARLEVRFAYSDPKAPHKGRIMVVGTRG